MKVLMVCLGNICRSPVAEGLLRRRAKEANKQIQVDSAGTSNYHIGEQPDSRSLAHALSKGTDISSLKARQFTIEDFDAFDKIFVMDYSNYENVVKLARDQNDINKVDLLLNQLYPGENQSVPDPYFGGDEGFEQVYNMVDAAVSEFLKKVD
jgi:protein-tyrosine phosphatase